MAGFRKAKAEQAALKLGIYGESGRGKTLTSLLIAEGLAKLDGKRIAYVDTERGTDFYAQPVPERKVHPEAFDFDALYTRSITEILSEVRALDPKVYGVVIIDSITHVWESAKAAYSGRLNAAGQIPFHAWAKIKRPYKDLMAFLLSTPMHVIFCGREGKEYANDEETDELKCVGPKMKAEGETPYEPHILLRLYTEKSAKGETTFWAYAEKDRTGILGGRDIQLWPSTSTAFELIAKPLLGLLGGTQAQIASEDETAAKDAENLSAEEAQKILQSERLLAEFSAKLTLCQDAASLKALGKEITPEVKRRMTTADITELRNRYLEAEKRIGGKD